MRRERVRETEKERKQQQEVRIGRNKALGSEAF
jgi:hypothetical protein